MRIASDLLTSTYGKYKSWTTPDNDLGTVMSRTSSQPSNSNTFTIQIIQKLTYGSIFELNKVTS